MGEQSTSLHQAVGINKGVPTLDGHDRHHQAQVDYAQGKCLTLIGCIVDWSHGVIYETRL